MRIDFINGHRTLINDYENINIDDGTIISYSGIYYKTINDIVHIVEIKTRFIGEIETHRSDITGFTGIYVKPLYIWNALKYEWNKIANYTRPNTKYFEYPHLLLLPEASYHGNFLHTLDSVTNVNPSLYINVSTLFYL
jgi:hypothetical protein